MLRPEGINLCTCPARAYRRDPLVLTGNSTLDQEEAFQLGLRRQKELAEVYISVKIKDGCFWSRLFSGVIHVFCL